MSTVAKKRWKNFLSNNIYLNIQAAADNQFPPGQPQPQQDNAVLLPPPEVAALQQDSDRADEPDVEKGLNQQQQGGNCKVSWGSGLFDGITNFAGTPLVLLFTVAALLGWALIGIVLGPTQVWQIALQNTSSIQCYVSDTLLVRQQHNGARDLLTQLCELRSRGATCRRILQRIRREGCAAQPGTSVRSGCVIAGEVQSGVEKKKHVHQVVDDRAVNLPPRSLYDRACDPVVTALSSLYALAIYWAGIFVWIGFGSALSWGNNWQLYINTATAVEITFVSVFIQNTRRRHMAYLDECFESLAHEDARLECRLRERVGSGGSSGGDAELNPVVRFQFEYREETTRGNRAVDWYAAIIGSGIGFLISTIVFSAWMAAGRAMGWSSNWWLIIGTYTGLVGFLDGFVLRNVYFREAHVIDVEFDVLAKEDVTLLELLGPGSAPPEMTEGAQTRRPLRDRLGDWIGRWCARAEAVLGACLVIVAVLVVATAMRWSETGQLICNTPTMIVEGFLLLALIQAHNTTHSQRRLQFRDILVRRLEMNARLERLLVLSGSS